jgi:hypothetical protein
MKNIIHKYLKEVSNNFKLLENESTNIEIASKIIISALNKKIKLFFVGMVDQQQIHNIYLQSLWVDIRLIESH